MWPLPESGRFSVFLRGNLPRTSAFCEHRELCELARGPSLHLLSGREAAARARIARLFVAAPRTQFAVRYVQGYRRTGETQNLKSTDESGDVRLEKMRPRARDLQLVGRGRIAGHPIAGMQPLWRPAGSGRIHVDSFGFHRATCLWRINVVRQYRPACTPGMFRRNLSTTRFLPSQSAGWKKRI